MSDERDGMTSGDPLGGGPQREPERDPFGRPGVTRGPEAPERPEQSAGYTTSPPPGAGGDVPVYQQVSQPSAFGQHMLASWGSRVGAQLIDGLIIGAGALLLFLVFGAVFSAGFAAGEDAGIASLILGALLWVACVAVVALIYAPALMARTNGKTLGRMVTNIRVVRTDGAPMTFGFAMLREVAVKALLFGIAGSLTGGILNLLDVLWPLWDEENRALHDFVVNTRTVKDPN